MSPSRPGRRTSIAATVAGLIAAPLAVVGASAPAHAATTQIQILGTNDFHGRLLPNRGEAGAAQFAGAVAQLESENPNTVFAAAGDLIGASTFESFIQQDKPTLDALNAAGLDVSAAGNHEFDAGYHDLVDRVMAPYDAATNEFGGAKWQYLAANVRKASDNSYALPDVAASPGVSDGGTWMTTVDGVEVGFVGTVTEDLGSLVSPDGISDVVVSGIVQETNDAADALTAAGADLVVMLVHEGATTDQIASLTDGSAFAQIVAGVDSDVDAIISGHTHKAYNHADPNPDTLGRPVVSAGQYGTNLNKLVFSVDETAGTVGVVDNSIVAAGPLELTAQSALDKRAEVQAIVTAAVDEAEVRGAVKLGELAGPFNRAKLSNGDENRGGESTLGNLVAEVQRWATSSSDAGAAEIAFMNPGGVREDMVGLNADGYPADLTYKQAAIVQPFANTLVNMQMTGAQIKTVLEQQWQPSGASRPFYRLGTSDGFRFTYDASRPSGDRITGMWLHGSPIDDASSYSVTANSFLASGGDNFGGFANATDKRDTGKADLQAMVDYMAANSPVAVDPTQHAVGLSFPPSAPAVYHPGEHVRFDVTSWAFTGAGDPQDKTVTVSLDGTEIGSQPVDNSLGAAPYDDYGTIAGDVTVPEGTPAGAHVITLTGDSTGTTLDIPVTTDLAPIRSDATVDAVATPATVKAGTGTSVLDVTVSTTQHTATGLVAAIVDGEVIGGGELLDGKAQVSVGPFDKAGQKLIQLKYYGDQGTRPATGQVTLTVEPAPVVEKATPTLTATVSPDKVRVMDDDTTVSLSVTKPSGTATGAVIALVDGKVAGAAELKDGKAEVSLAPFTSVGNHAVQLKYFGDDATKAGDTTVQVQVRKARAKLQVKAPKKVDRGARARIQIRVSAENYTPTGKVTVKVRGEKVTKRLKDGRVTIKIRMTKLGKNKVKVRYHGDELTRSASEKRNIRVTRR